MNPSATHPRSVKQLASRQRGVTLIEVMVSVLIFSLGLLGLVGLQARATQQSVAAEDASRAALLAGEIESAMLIRNTVNLPTEVLTAWNTRVADTAGNGLPNGSGTVTVAAGVATVTLIWRPVQAAAGVQHRFVTQVMLP